MKFIKTGLTMALFPGHLGMRLCSNCMRHVSVYCTPKTELLIRALWVLSLYILYTVNHIVTLLLLYPAFAGTDVLCQEDYDFFMMIFFFFVFPKCIHICTCTIFLCKNSFEFVYIYIYIHRYIFSTSTLVSN